VAGGKKKKEFAEKRGKEGPNTRLGAKKKKSL